MSVARNEPQRVLRRAALKRMRAKRWLRGECLQCGRAAQKFVRCILHRQIQADAYQRRKAAV